MIKFLILITGAGYLLLDFIMFYFDIKKFNKGRCPKCNYKFIIDINNDNDLGVYIFCNKCIEFVSFYINSTIFWNLYMIYKKRTSPIIIDNRYKTFIGYMSEVYE